MGSEMCIRDSIDMEDGTSLKASDFRGQERPTTRMVISGDTAEMAKGLTSISQTDVLVHESTFIDEAQQWADQFLHSTSTGAARTAIACNARHLVLTHFSARLKDAEIPLAEAKDVFGSTEISVSAAMDGDRIKISDTGDISHLVWADDGWSS